MGKALYSACHILNKVSHNFFFKKNPYEPWRKKEPNLKYLKMWECLVKVKIPINNKRKIGQKTVDYVFVGYSLDSTTYRFLVVKSLYGLK